MPWVAVLAATGAYDLWLIHSGRDSLTSIAKRNRLVTIGTSVYLFTHLTGSLPQRADAFHKFGLR